MKPEDWLEALDNDSMGRVLAEFGGFQYPPATQLVEVSLDGLISGGDLGENREETEGVGEYVLSANGWEEGLGVGDEPGESSSIRDSEATSQSLS